MLPCAIPLTISKRIIVYETGAEKSCTVKFRNYFELIGCTGTVRPQNINAGDRDSRGQTDQLQTDRRTDATEAPIMMYLHVRSYDDRKKASAKINAGKGIQITTCRFLSRNYLYLHCLAATASRHFYEWL
jgi:hypothetical protein